MSLQCIRQDVDLQKSGAHTTKGLHWFIDIGGCRLPNAMKRDLVTNLLSSNGKISDIRLLPSAVLHDDTGLRMWRDVNSMPQYYQTKDEIELLKQNASHLATHITEGTTLIDLGCG